MYNTLTTDDYTGSDQTHWSNVSLAKIHSLITDKLKTVMLSPWNQSGLKAEILASDCKRSFGLSLKHLASAWPLSHCLIM